MAKTASLPLYEVKFRKNIIPRTIELVILFLLVSLLGYRILSLRDHGYPWILALLCESWFTFNWILVVSSKWSPIETQTSPQRLLQYWSSSELPAVDMFVTTADAELEAPIITVNTVLSLLAVDYPANKLACYVSDDAASPLTFYSLVEATEFSKLWVPFCNKYNISLRAPFRYFEAHPNKSSMDTSPEFHQDFKRVKEEYAKLCEKIEAASRKPEPCPLSGEYAVFSDIQRGNHSSIVKVIWENKGGVSDGLPHLIYISREKRPKHPHNFKAGAMNALTRVSGVMTNAPFMLNVDCDMYANNPTVVLQAMCVLLGGKDERDSGFVQFPQNFYDGLKDDPFGNQLTVLLEYLGRGIAGIQGSFYQGTGCFHRRKVIYGLSPNQKITGGDLMDEELRKAYGKSSEFSKSAAKILSTSNPSSIETSGSLTDSIEVASQVAGCGFEYGTMWGKRVGWIYGSATEDINTGINIHGRGWRSVYCTPDPPAFRGCGAASLPPLLIQQKRWSTGLSEILFSSRNPFFRTFGGALHFRQCLAYTWILVWGLRSIFEICYAALPAYCIITGSHIWPQISEAAIIIPISVLIIYNLYTLSEYIRAGLSVRAWWNNQRMWKIISATAWFFGLLGVVLKLLGLSTTAFEVTKKDTTNSRNDTNNQDSGIGFTFDDSPILIPATVVLFVNLAALFIGLFGVEMTTKVLGEKRMHFGELICCVWVVLYFWPFVKGLFGKGKYGIPLSTIVKAGAFTLLFVHFCIRV